MRTCPIHDLFDVQYGNSLELVYLEKDPNGINFVSRTAKNNGVSAKVRKSPLEPAFPAGVLTVAVGGSVLETFLQMKPFYTGFHVMVLSPKVAMTIAEKLYYCLCIRENRKKYNYGRQANETLADLPIPTLDSIPDYVRSMSLKRYGEEMIRSVEFLPDTSSYPENEKTVPLSSLFRLVNGIASSQVLRIPEPISDQWIPYVRPSYRQANSIDAYVNRNLIPDEKIFPSGTLYVSTDGQGSHTYSYVSSFSFVPNSNVTVLLPKRAMNLQEKLYYAMCISKNRYKFSYGRKPKGQRLKEVLLPEYPPKYVTAYDMDQAVRGFSDVLERI